MALTINPSFTYEITELTIVQFTNTTQVIDGFARLFIWEFADGWSSTEENPIHTFAFDEGSLISKTRLCVLATSTEMQALTSSFTNATEGDSGSTERNGLGNTNNLAWLDFLGASPVSFFSGSAGFVISRTGSPQRQYKQQISNIKVETATTNALNLLLLQPASLTILTGTLKTSCGDKLIPSSSSEIPVFGGTLQLVKRLKNLTSINPFKATVFVEPIQILPDTPTNNTQSGMRGFAYRVQSFFTSSSQAFACTEGPETLDLAFSGTPLSGSSPLQVQFTDLTETGLVDPCEGVDSSILNPITIASETWDFGDGNTATFAGSTNPLNTYVSNPA